MEKTIVSFVFLLFISHLGFSQEMNSNSFDFWIGDWDLTWTNKQGETKKGSNKILKILDGNVIQENFEDLQTGFKGMSLSVFNPKSKKWNQAWADNRGGYYDFRGTVEGDSRIFMTEVQEIQGHQVIRRMVFKDITEDSLTWDWELSTDNGATWNLRWRINYKRKE